MNESTMKCEAARKHVLRTQNPGIATLQPGLGLGHAEAANEAADLRQQQVLLPPWPGRQPGLHPDHLRVHVQSIKGDARLVYIERVMQLALLYFELAEEDCDAHSEAVRARLPSPKLDWRQTQALFRRDWFGQHRMALTDAALAFHYWLRAQGVGSASWNGIEAAIRAHCLPYERTRVDVRDGQARTERGYVRLARFFRHMACEDITCDSRAVQWFVPDRLVPQNQKRPGTHPEHVVPCAVLRNLASDCFAEHRSVHQVTALLRRLLVVIWIEQNDRRLLDDGSDNLRSIMTPGWHPSGGCLYARLHAKNIAFSPVPGYPCTCNKSA